MAFPLLLALCTGLPLSASYPHQGGYSVRPTVSLDQSLVLGKTSEVPSASHAIINQYLGVPFARSPPKRFEPPEDPIPRNSTWDASYLRPSCIQHFASTDSHLHHIPLYTPL